MAHVDLNLLVALDALLEENSVAGAAERLHLSAPAMSRTLARIRRATGDDILVRTGRSMTPTPRAMQLRDETHLLVQRAKLVLAPEGNLDLQTLERVFSIRGHDALSGVLAPALTGVIRMEAPNVAVRFLAETSVDNADLPRGHVDMEVGAAQPALPEICAETLGNDRIVVAFRPDHPLAHGAITPERLAAAAHVTVSRRGRLRDVIDDALAERGLRRRVLASLPTSAAALDLAAQTGVVVVIAEQLCRAAWTSLGLHTKSLPFELSPLPVILTWHRRYETDSAHTWLRGHVRAALHSAMATTADAIEQGPSS